MRVQYQPRMLFMCSGIKRMITIEQTFQSTTKSTHETARLEPLEYVNKWTEITTKLRRLPIKKMIHITQFQLPLQLREEEGIETK